MQHLELVILPYVASCGTSFWLGIVSVWSGLKFELEVTDCTMLNQMNACVAKFVFEVPTWILLRQTKACIAIFEFEVPN